MDTESVRRFTAVVEAISSNTITPNYHFGKIGQYLLNPYVTTGFPPQPTQEPVSVTSSLMHAGPNILVLTIVTTIAFIISYMVFKTGSEVA